MVDFIAGYRCLGRPVCMAASYNALATQRLGWIAGGGAAPTLAHDARLLCSACGGRGTFWLARVRSHEISGDYLSCYPDGFGLSGGQKGTGAGASAGAIAFGARQVRLSEPGFNGRIAVTNLAHDAGLLSSATKSGREL